MAANILRSAKDSAAGPEVFKTIQEMQGLSPQQKDQVILKTVEIAVAAECQAAANHPHTVLRGNSSSTAFIKSVLDSGSQEYQDAMKKDVSDAVHNAPLPMNGFTDVNNPTGVLSESNIPGPGFIPTPGQEMSAEQIAEWNNLYCDVSRAVIEANNQHLDKLTPLAKATLQTCSSVTQEQFANNPGVDGIVTAMNANNVMLRLANPILTQQSTVDPMANPTAQAVQQKLFTQSSAVTQTYFNQLSNDNWVPQTKPGQVAAMLRQDLNLTNEVKTGLAQAAIGDPAQTMSQVAYPKAKLSIREKLAAKVSDATQTFKAKLGLLNDTEMLERRTNQIQRRRDHRKAITASIQKAENEIVERIKPIKTTQPDGVPTEDEKNAAIKSFVNKSDVKSEMIDGLGANTPDMQLRKNYNRAHHRENQNELKIEVLKHQKKALDDRIKLRNSQGQSVEAPAHGTHVK